MTANHLPIGTTPRLGKVIPAAGLAAALGAAVHIQLPSPAAAQTTELPPVVVEGTTRAVRPPAKTPVEAPPRAARRAPATAQTPPAATPAPIIEDGTVFSPGDLLANQGTATTVITNRELLDQQVNSPAEALRGTPGVVVGRTGPFGGITQVRIRGAESQHTLVLIDGIEANNPGDGEFDFSNIIGGPEFERIEVLRGPQSGLYGSGAIGGVVNIVTKSGKGPLSLASFAEYGSFNTKAAGATLSAGNDKAWGLIGTTTRKTNGFNVSPVGNEQDGSQTTSSIFKGGFSPIEGLTIEGVMRHTGKRADRDDENFVPFGLVQQGDTLSRFSSNLWLGSLEAKLSSFGGAWVQSLRSESRSIVNDDLAAPFNAFSRYRANAETYRYTSTFRLDTPGVPQVRHFVTGLAETKREGFIQYTDDNVDHERDTRSVVGEVRGEYWNTLFLSGSVRRDDTDVFGDFTTWRTSASLKVPGTPLRVHGSMGTGVKLPSMFEQFGSVPSRFLPNPNLTPETSSGWDAGAELTFFGGRAIIDATWFDNELKNKIAGRFVGFTATSENLPGISTRRGLELAGKVIPLAGLTIGASYTWLDAEEPTGIVEARRPRNSGRIDATYSFDRDRAKVGIAALYNGSMFDDSALRVSPPCAFGFCTITNERVTLKDYWLVSALASYKLTPQLELYGRVENALDQRYQEVFGFQTPGAAVYGGLRLTLQEQASVSR